VNKSGPDEAPNDLTARRVSLTDRGGWPWFGRVRWMLVLAGAVAGLVAFGIGEKTRELIPADKVKMVLMGNVTMVSDWKTTAVAERRNGAITFGALGLCLGASLGIVGGLARRSAAGALMGGLLGSMLGLAIGAGVSYVLLPRFIAARFDHVEYDFLISMGMHGLLWGLPGAAAGLAFAVGLGDIRRWIPSLAAGLFGAMLGAVAYEFIGATLFVTADTGKPISDAWATRLLAPLLVCVGTALAVAILLPEASPVVPQPQPQPDVTPPAPGTD
jgi:hypothetical protein